MVGLSVRPNLFDITQVAIGFKRVASGWNSHLAQTPESACSQNWRHSIMQPWLSPYKIHLSADSTKKKDEWIKAKKGEEWTMEPEGGCEGGGGEEKEDRSADRARWKGVVKHALSSPTRTDKPHTRTHTPGSGLQAVYIGIWLPQRSASSGNDINRAGFFFPFLQPHWHSRAWDNVCGNLSCSNWFLGSEGIFS